MSKVNNYLNNDEYVSILAEEIVELFQKKSNSNNTYCEFDLIKGKMGNIKDNTWFSIDINNKDLELYKFKKSLFDKDLGDMTKEDERDLQSDVEDFFEKIKEYIENNYISEIRNVIRKICMPDSDPELMPMDLVVLRNLDITDIESIYDNPGPYVLSVYKNPNDPNFDPEVYKKDISSRMKDILNYLSEKANETDKDISELFDEEKNKPQESKHFSFEGINPQCKIKKMDWDINLSFFVDYSLKVPSEN